MPAPAGTFRNVLLRPGKPVPLGNLKQETYAGLLMELFAVAYLAATGAIK